MESGSALLKLTALVLSGSAVGSCLLSEEQSLSLGVVQISPQATENGSLSILYVNGDRCGDQRFSTRIIFECAQMSVSVRAAALLSPFPRDLESSLP